ncbi:enoyl-[acyl-carrier-protein] reductase [Mycolicibacterium hassiacum DSM 44199]|jgi:enoyl ACP reductase|uniref:Enoyl-[acyl-carrier-protein] reductase [NADH] n=1 Tax=Mycolicibacterium hassiacum (strain DSM 44199 / CIP 105218 / JCM 12690 / 3849) TaxID=1122247 RepID=K5BJW0_MYCHD|nr:NADH-dependent enoyl-ACP reductase InhA [Mycolicibacterium hassiacum]EKF23799.1 enoyl-[acyl-carrier-protein] reductase [Mycolicibacterium hassiacum DSM 44199]MBX5485493.1 enoyl-ACP reductase FabI [Mycolicibacterium hassiacum]MDA4085856.1 enoyl-ACP reductase [Mycolicibacterium hassiacum DSM 44199]PZN24845.1 MAG: enoyl-[acyl-carrier-protein] reductase FabI [Mycolicibacterium hassiacum]VCT90405.1 Enoyl-[acyl-carrier-protein] reductase [NADH] [Mycolicibacterium hassiacum DSM 44199]
MTGLLEGKRILVTGIITDSSIAFHIAKVAQEAGAELVLTGYDRLRLIQRIVDRLPKPAPLLELDVQNQEHLDTLAERVTAEIGEGNKLDGVVHSIGFMPQSGMGLSPFLDAPYEDVSKGIHISAYSYAALAKALLPIMNRGGSIVGMDFDPSRAMPAYNWMTVAKSALESINRFVAREAGPYGVRSNLVAAGPIRTLAMSAIVGGALGEETQQQIRLLEEGWDQRAPVGWNMKDPTPVAKTVCALLSDWLPATTGTVIYADGGASTQLL